MDAKRFSAGWGVNSSLKWPAIRSAGLRGGQPASDVSLGFSGLRAAAASRGPVCASALTVNNNAVTQRNADWKRRQGPTVNLFFRCSIIETPPVFLRRIVLLHCSACIRACDYMVRELRLLRDGTWFHRHSLTIKFSRRGHRSGFPMFFKAGAIAGRCDHEASLPAN